MSDRIGLVACCGEKAQHPLPARDMYRSNLFCKSRVYAERTCDQWAILSAEHGVVGPDEVIAPYDKTLNRMSTHERRAWAAKTKSQLVKRFPRGRFTVLAGSAYRSAVDGLPHTAPMVGLGIGRQLSWLSRRTSGTLYLMAVSNRENIKLAGERRPFWEFLNEEPAGWLSSLAYPVHPEMPGGVRVLDCGAWSYKGEDTPKLRKAIVTPGWAVEEYTKRARRGDFAIAPDHMLIPGLGYLESRRLFNAASARGFLSLARGAGFRPMAAVHGETITERIETAKRYADMGYTSLALGGLAGQAGRKKMAKDVVAAVRAAVPGVWLHVLGLSSPDYFATWRQIGVESCDGSSHFKQAFTGGVFFTRDGGKLIRNNAARPGEPITAPKCDCLACSKLREDGVDTRTYGSNEHNMGRAAHNLNQLIAAQAEYDFGCELVTEPETGLFADLAKQGER